MSLVKGGYYNHPDGVDCYGKLMATNGYAVAGGVAWSTFDCLMVSHTKGYLPTLARFGYNIGPFMGMATAFTITTYGLTNLRKKDDCYNYFLGGFAAGGVCGAWKRSPVMGCVMGLFFGIAGVVKKTSVMDGWEFFPDPNHIEINSINPVQLSLVAERPKTWTTGKE